MTGTFVSRKGDIKMRYDIKVYIVNLRKYTVNESTGEWFTLPIDYRELDERLELNGVDEIAIHDYEAPFQIDEYSSVNELNRIYDMVESLPDYLYDNLDVLVEELGDIETVVSLENRIEFYSGIFSIEALAREIVQETSFGEGEWLKEYIDYQFLAKNLEIENAYVQGKTGLLKII